MSDKLTDGSEVLFRQIHPNHFQGGEPSSDRFRPSVADENRLSVDRSSVVTPQESHAHYTSNGAKSVAVFGVTVGEFNSEDIECIEDPRPPENGRAVNKAHALSDYSSHTSKNQKIVAKRLKNIAVARGVLYSFE